MSASEAERFANDLKTNTGLLDDLKKSAAGLGLSGVVEFAKQKGYQIDVSDAKAYVETKVHKELSDEQLDRIAGGKGGGSGPGGTAAAPQDSSTSNSVAQTTNQVSTAVGFAEVSVFVVAFGAIVVT